MHILTQGSGAGRQVTLARLPGQSSHTEAAGGTSVSVSPLSLETQFA